ncbi:hypothetical protein ICN10_01745 [Polynucleobacter sp. 86C-FISCH]|uniref:hypothetical protein n=1 Tax=Polynucleobacter sp. 86C-FISCH TaxID=2689101 RepID=UPI001C0D91D8|nr:hypothetical protein [Polynucleobacter sp. 86C-FISCH]MBU3595120.1 hypothetical protein [Polynucleobacter sp. 86C-FISCH]
MKLAQIRQKTAFNPNALPTQKVATRDWLRSIHKNYPVALTLTLKQVIEVKSNKGSYYKKIDKEECRQIAKRFTQKLNQQIFGNSAKRYGKGLKYLIVVEGERSCKNLHLHMAIGEIPSHIKWNEIKGLVDNAKTKVVGIDKESEVSIADSGWMDYLTKELGRADTDNVLWDLA